MREMSSRCLQVLSMATLMSLSWGHLLDADGFHNWRYNLPQVPHHLEFPPHLQPLPPPRTILPLIPLQPPPQYILVPVHVRGSFPPFIERIVQRIQTWWSFYNPPETLTRPPPSLDAPTTNSPKKKPTPTTTTTATTLEAETEAATEETEAVEAAETTTSAPATSDSVSTLAVFEVTPSAPSLAEDTEEPLFITPEKASLLGGQREAYLRFLQTGTLPPYLEADTINEMDD